MLRSLILSFRVSEPSENSHGTKVFKREYDVRVSKFPDVILQRLNVEYWLKIFLVHKLPKGYPRLAGLISSDENFMIYRKFGFLQARLLLFKQDELRQLERRLDDIDLVDGIKSPELLECRQRDDARSGKRKILLEKISQCFQEYGTLRCFSSPAIPRKYWRGQQNSSWPPANLQALTNLHIKTSSAWRVTSMRWSRSPMTRDIFTAKKTSLLSSLEGMPHG